ncbi:ATP-binding protein [Streptomyces sp. NPDC058424]|uniref:ATP-binding protein n=1 Tax=Streptomyces sp. NPDC058424 TaxID=3346491 RepID=UPI00364D0FF8
MSVSFGVSRCGAGRRIADADARRVQMARRVTAARLRYCGLTELIDDAALIVSELVTNAIVHSGGTQITFTMAIRDSSLCISVHDEMPGGPTVHNASSEAERGRGLFLVECIANAHGGTWGTSDAGATTWCRLTLPKVQP